jgi:Fe-S cluster assembly protein SufD
MATSAPHPDLISRALDAAARAAGGDGQPRPFAELRAGAAERLAILGAPTKKLEAWKYTDLRKVLARDYAFAGDAGLSTARAPRVTAAEVNAARVPGLDATTLVFVNGAFEPALSSLDAQPGLTVGSLRQVLSAGAPALFGTIADAHDAAFVALNQAFELDGPYVLVAAGTMLERPVQIVHLTSADRETFVQSRGLIIVEAGAHARIVETHAARGAGAATLVNGVTEVFVGDDAVVDHHRIQDEGLSASHINTTHVAQGARSVYRTGTWTFSGELVRNDLTVTLRGENAETNLAGLYFLRGDQHVDNRTLLDHAAPGCTSDELYRGIVFDRAVGVFNGKVMVRREGQQTNAYQQSQGVVLSDDAKHFSKPELEIYADDVKCSHGSTTGEVDPEAMFYLRSRGIAFERARALLLTAFAHDVVERVGIDALRAHLDRLVDTALS